MKKKLIKIMSCAMAAIMALSAIPFSVSAEEGAAIEVTETEKSATNSLAEEFAKATKWAVEEEISAEGDDVGTKYYKIVVPFKSAILFYYDTYNTKDDMSLVDVELYNEIEKKYATASLKGLTTMLLTIPKGTYYMAITNDAYEFEGFCYSLYPTSLDGQDQVKIENDDGSYTYGLDYYTKAVTGGGNVTITWKPVDGATSYRVYRWKDGKFTRLAIRTSTYFIDTSAEIGETYKYYVSAYNTNTSIESSMVTANGGYDVTVTNTFNETPQILSTSVLSTSVTLKWNVVPGATTYRIYRRNDDGTRKLLGAQSMTEFKDTGLTKGKIYRYEIRAYSSTTKSLTPYSKIKSVRPMAAPTILSGNVKGKITWDKNAVATGYRVYRAESLTGARTLLKAVNSTTYTDTTAESGKLYYYFVRAYDNKTGTLSAYSNMKAIKIA